jgi:hypothetical protein
MWPEDYDILELTVLGALQRHGHVAPVLPAAKTGLVTNGFAHKFGHLRGCEPVLAHTRRKRSMRPIAWATGA